MIATFVVWFAPTLIMVARYQAVVGHQKMVECITIVLLVSDTTQFLCGRGFGRTRIFPRLSPGKTLEGYIGGVILTCIFGSLAHRWAVMDIVIIYACGCGGDLYFSWVKRRLEIKDYSRVLSAHGGILDRIDSFVFAASALFWIAWFK